MKKGTGGSYVGRGFVLVVSSLLVLPPPPLLMDVLGVGVPLPLVLLAWLSWEEASCDFGWRRWPARQGLMLCDGIGRSRKV